MDADVLGTSDGRNFKVLGQLPQPGSISSSAVVGNVVWLFGGETQATEGGTVARTDVIQRFDVTTGTAGTAGIAGHLPTPISHAMAFTHSGDVFSAGGRTSAGATADILKSISQTERQVQMDRFPMLEAMPEWPQSEIRPTSWVVNAAVQQTH